MKGICFTLLFAIILTGFSLQNEKNIELYEIVNLRVEKDSLLTENNEVAALAIHGLVIQTYKGGKVEITERELTVLLEDGTEERLRIVERQGESIYLTSLDDEAKKMNARLYQRGDFFEFNTGTEIIWIMKKLK